MEELIYALKVQAYGPVLATMDPTGMVYNLMVKLMKKGVDPEIFMQAIMEAAKDANTEEQDDE